jgi:uncharacterized protein (TIGR03905 family)
MAVYTYNTHGVCSRQIEFEVEDGIVKNVKFFGGCNGNLQGIGRLVEGMEIDEVIEKLEGVNCNGKGTSCPDQLAKALKEVEY